MSGWEQRNADFCKAQADAGFAYIEAERRVKALEAENDQLRKLVRDVHALGWSGFDCTECPRSFYERCHEDGGCPWVFILTDRMRKLGVEL